MAPILALLVQTLLPIAVQEAKDKIAAGEVKATPAPAPDPHAMAVTSTLSGAVSSKTMWAAAILAALGYLEQNQGLVSQYIGADKMGIVMLVVSGIMVVLRTITTGSLSDKADAKTTANLNLPSGPAA